MTGVGAPVTTRRTRTRDRWIGWDSTAFICVAAFVLIGIHGRTAYAWCVPEGRLGRAMKKAGVNAPEAAIGSLEDDLTNYWWHGSRIPVGSNLMETYESFDACERECDAKGFACAGFKKDLTTDFCTLVGRGFGLQRAAESDFYRKKSVHSKAKWKAHEGKMVAFPDLLAWRAVNGKSETGLRTLCASDSQCQGYYTCINTTDCAARMYKKHDTLGLSTTRPFDVSTTSAMLLKSVTYGSSMLNDSDFVVHSRAIPTCEGTAGGAPCVFPFTTDYNARQRQTVVEFF